MAQADDRQGPDSDAFEVADDPFAWFDAWFRDAQHAEPNDPNAMALATVDRGGLPNVRMVLLKGVDPAGTGHRGFVFYTNSESAKGTELLANMQAALCFHWKSLERQVRVRGSISLVSNAEADDYYASRPRLSRIGAWASRQSRPLDGRKTLESAVASFTEKFAVGDVPRPPHWRGFRLTPVEIEFWKSRPFRLHDRMVFSRQLPDEEWSKTRLFP